MADEQGRWFKLFASITESDVFGDAQALRCWIWCLKSANWKPQMCKRQMFPRGTFWCNIREAASECRCAVKTWDQAIEHLVKLGMICAVRSPKCITITVVNYDRFQTGIVVKNTTNGDTNGSTNGTTNGDTNGSTNGSTVTTTRSRSPRTDSNPENTPAAAPPGDSSDKPAKPKAKPPAFDPLAVPIPQSLDTPLFRQAWAAWAAHRVEIKARLTEQSTKQQIRLLAELGHDKAVETIRTSIRQSWRGLFPQPAKGQSDRPNGMPSVIPGMERHLPTNQRRLIGE
jgi:hypothetical protein